MTIQTLYPDIKPTLNLDFANTEKLDGRITFARASSSRYYDGKTVALAEENLFQFSQEFDNAYWNKASATITANNQTAPDGTTTADTVTATSGTNVDVGASRFNLSSTSGLDYVISVFAKAGTYSVLQITTSNFQASSAHANFDLNLGVLGTFANCTSSIQSAGNGWYRCTIIFNATATVGTGAAFILLSPSTSAGRFAKWSPVGTETIFLWGAQLEQRSSVTAYTATTTQPITNYIPVLLTATDNVARFDHNPTTSESLGLLVEEQRTNLLLYSQEFDNAAWGKVRSSVQANVIVAPDGTLTGDNLVENIDNNSHYIAQDFTQAGATTYTYTVYAKSAGRRYFRLVGSTTGNASSRQAYFDLNTGTTAGLVDATSTITAVGNGWYRCSITFVSTAEASYRFAVWLLSNDIGATYTGNGYSGIFIWGAQLEAGAFPTSYIPTVASQVTRSSDAASMTGANFSSWYGRASNTIYAEFSSIVTGAASQSTQAYGVCSVSDSGNAGFNGYGVRGVFNSSGNDALQFTGRSGSTIVNATRSALGFISPSVIYKTASGWDSTSLAFASQGVVGISVSNTIFSQDSALNVFNIGTQTIGGAPPYALNGHIRKLAYYPKRLTNAQLQALTA